MYKQMFLRGPGPRYGSRKNRGGSKYVSSGVRRRGRRWARSHPYKGKFAQQVKNVLMRNAETKYVRDDIVDNVTFNSTVSAYGDFYRAFPSVQQGIQSNQRLAQRLTPKKISLMINAAFNTTDALSRDIEVHVWVLKNKSQHTVLADSAAGPGYNSTNGWLNYNAGELLDNGTGANTSFGGTYLDTTKQVNKDAWIVIKKYVRHLYKGSGTSNNNQVANNERRHFSLRCSLPLHQFVYDEQSDLLPTNYAPCFAIGYRYLDGTTPDDESGILKVTASTAMWFKDV